MDATEYWLRIVLPRALRVVGVVVLVALWWQAISPVSLLRIIIFGPLGTSFFFITWVWAADLEVHAKPVRRMTPR